MERLPSLSVLNIVKMAILPKTMYMFNVIPAQNLHKIKAVENSNMHSERVLKLHSWMRN